MWYELKKKKPCLTGVDFVWAIHVFEVVTCRKHSLYFDLRTWESARSFGSNISPWESWEPAILLGRKQRGRSPSSGNRKLLHSTTTALQWGSENGWIEHSTIVLPLLHLAWDMHRLGTQELSASNKRWQEPNSTYQRDSYSLLMRTCHTQRVRTSSQKKSARNCRKVGTAQRDGQQLKNLKMVQYQNLEYDWVFKVLAHTHTITGNYRIQTQQIGKILKKNIIDGKSQVGSYRHTDTQRSHGKSLY